MNKDLEIGEDVFEYINNFPLNSENIRDLIEYVHYKSMLNLFTYILENNNGENIDYILTDYIEVLSKIQIIINKIKLKGEQYNEESEKID